MADHQIKTVKAMVNQVKSTLMRSLIHKPITLSENTSAPVQSPSLLISS